MGTRSIGVLVGAFVLAALSASVAVAQGAAPTTQPDQIEVEEDTVVVGYPLLNDSDPGGETLELVSVAATPAGTARIDGSAVVFTPAPDWFGETELTYTVRSSGGEATGVITIIVKNVNDVPVANDDAVTTAGSQSVGIEVLTNDTDADGDALVIGTVNSPAHGAVTVADGAIEYTAQADFTGDDSFSYRVFDPAGESAEAVVTVTVTPASAGAASTQVPSPTLAPTASDIEVVAPRWAAPPIAPIPQEGESESFFTGLTRHLGTLLMPLLLLGLIGVVAWLVSQRERTPGRKHAVVLVGRGELLDVHDKPGSDSKVVHQFEYSSRQIDVVGRRRVVDGVEWVPVATSDGRGWVDSQYLTEDVARATFERDLSERDMVRELRRRLKEGATISASSRGVIDPEGFYRDGERRELGGNATARLTALLEDWRASFHVDRSASIAALRPPQLRNLHWVSFEAPGLDPWQLFFEYRDGQPYPVAALPENVAVSV